MIVRPKMRPKIPPNIEYKILEIKRSKIFTCNKLLCTGGKGCNPIILSNTPSGKDSIDNKIRGKLVKTVSTMDG
jgi:hypothetical protein